jgi:hypothetical protein
MADLTINDILEQVKNGQIRIPAFQRGFVWDAERVAYLMDSIYKGFPFGSLLLWQSKERLDTERDLGPFKVPDLKEDYPVFYVLDGQQRITSIFGVFQHGLEPTEDAAWLDIYFDLNADQSAQENQFIALKKDEAEDARYFPLRSLFDIENYSNLTREMENKDALRRIDDMRNRFTTIQIPAQITKTEDRATVAIIFERVNRQGVALNTFQLLTAWTWSTDFLLQAQFEELSDEIEPFGFSDVGADTNLLLRCCSAVLTGDASPKALMELNGENVRNNFDKITNGIKYAIDYLRTNFKVERLSNLPFSTQIVPLSVFFAVPGNKEASYADEQRQKINRWFWRSSLSRRYSSGVLRNLKTDIEEMANLRDGKESKLGDFPVTASEEFFTENIFGIGNVNTKTFILLLAANNPRSFISGAQVDLAEKLKDANRSEFHHLMPRQFLKDSGQDKFPESCLANFAFLSRADNRSLGGKAPSVYKAQMGGDVDATLNAALCPASLFEDGYEKFVLERARVLAAEATKLI